MVLELTVLADAKRSVANRELLVMEEMMVVDDWVSVGCEE